MKRYSCNVHLKFELEAKTAGEAVDAIMLMLHFIAATVQIARGFRHVAWHVPPTEPRELHPTEVSDG